MNSIKDFFKKKINTYEEIYQVLMELKIYLEAKNDITKFFENSFNFDSFLIYFNTLISKKDKTKILSIFQIIINKKMQLNFIPPYKFNKDEIISLRNFEEEFENNSKLLKEKYYLDFLLYNIINSIKRLK